ncbi:P-loop containing nucleoside triphosphate hydrolase protein [Tuber brumale]|nr:P-loop containing nucleoside triphosphate hydrolase protein [Tuber brumale]
MSSTTPTATPVIDTTIHLPAAGIIASTLLTQNIRQSNKAPHFPKTLSTSCSALDQHALSSGFPYGHLTSISGASATGKSLIAMHALVTHLLLHYNSSAAWVDTLGTFSPSLLQQVVSSRTNNDSKTISSVLDRVQIMRVFNIHGLIEAVDELRTTHLDREKHQRVVNDSKDEASEEEEPPPEPFDGTRVIVIDTISQPITALMTTGPLQAQARMVGITRSLSGLARRYNVCALLLNTTVSKPTCGADGGQQTYTHTRGDNLSSAFSAATSKPALGNVYSHCVDVNVLLTRVKVRGRRRIGESDGGGRNGDVVMEVLSDRTGGGRAGMWSAFGIVGIPFEIPREEGKQWEYGCMGD